MATAQVGSETKDINGVPHLLYKPQAKDPESNKEIIGQLHPAIYPRFAGIATFCRLPLLASLPPSIKCDIAVVGVPFDAGCSYRTGARFGPSAIREASRLYRPYNIQLQKSPFKQVQVCDGGDVACSPFNIDTAVKQIYEFCCGMLTATNCMAIMGGDHTVAYPAIKAVVDTLNHGAPVAVIHFDAHLDTYPAVYGSDIWHGSPFRKCFEDELIDVKHSIHVGVRNSIWDHSDFKESESMGFDCILCNDVHERGVDWTIRRILDRVGQECKVYVSIDIDVLDVSQAPGTGTPEIAGLWSHQLLSILSGLRNLDVISCDVVEVLPAYDSPNSQITALAASGILYQMITLMGDNIVRKRKRKLGNAKL